MGHRILLADDSLTIQKVVELTFSETDYELMAVGSGDRAVEALEEFRPDIVLADVVMPGLTGYEVCAAVKKRPDGAAIPVILLTGTFEPFDRARAESVGCDSIVTKPFDSHALSSLVEELIAKGAKTRAALSAAPAPVAPAPVAPAPVAPAPVQPAAPFPPPRPPVPLPPAQDPFTDTVTVAFPLPTPVEPALSEPPPLPEDVFGTAVPEEPASPVEDVPTREPTAGFDLAETMKFAAPAAPLATSSPLSPVDEDTHPLLVIVPPPPAEEEEEAPEPEDLQTRDIERDLEAFERSGQGSSRPEVWDRAESLGVVSRAETAGGHPVAEVVSASRETGDLEALAARASVKDLSHLIPAIPAAKEPAPAPAVAVAGGLSDAEVERIARRVIEMIGEKILRDIAWDVVPEMADRMVRERLAEIEKG